MIDKISNHFLYKKSCTHYSTCAGFSNQIFYKIFRLIFGFPTRFYSYPKKEELENLFSEFHRSDIDNNKDIEGAGLGLAIIKQLTEQMGGRVYVDSTYHSGSVFTVIIPQQKVKENDKTSFEAPDAKILVVDDYELNHKVVSGLLKRTKMQIDTAESGEECLKKISENEYHLILMDERLPQLSGTETLQEIKKHGLTRGNTKILALTAEYGEGTREKFLRMGFDDYLSKPIEPEVLEKSIARLLPDELVKRTVPEEPKTDLPEWLTRNKFFNTAEGIKMCGNSDVYMATILGFSNAAKKNYTFESDDELIRKIHSIKSVAALIGCSRVYTLANEIETTRNVAKASEFFALCKEVAETLFPLNEDNTYPESLEEVDKNTLPILYRHMREYASDCNDEAVGSMLRALSRYEMPKSEKEKFENIKEAYRAADWIKLQNILTEKEE